MNTTDTNLPAVVPCATPTVKFLWDLCLSPSRNQNTVRSYRRAVDDFATFLQAPDAITALKALLEHPHGTANAVVSAYRNHLVEKGMAPASVSNRLGALRSIVKDARRFGLVNWQLDIKVGKVEGYRDTRGPGAEPFMRMLEAVEEVEDEKKRARDRVILRMLFDLGLRRFELASLDIGHIDFIGSRVSILGKGRSGREWMTLAPVTLEAIRDWVAVRGTFDGPLIVNLDRACQNAASGRRLSGEGIRKIVAGYGDAVGVRCRPHGVRHLVATMALEATNGNIRETMKLTRHRSPSVLMIYDDNRRDAGGALSKMLSGMMQPRNRK